MDVINRVIYIKREKGIKTNYLCSKLNAHRGILDDWNRGKGFPSDSQIDIIAQVLDVPFDWLKNGGELDGRGYNDIKKDPSPEDLERDRQERMLEHYLLEKGIIPDLSEKNLTAVKDLLLANKDIIKKIIDSLS